MGADTGSGRGRSWLRWVGLGVVLAGHLVALYLPGSPEPGGPEIPGLDKVAHVLLFAVPAFGLWRLAGRWWPIALLVLHAPVSELVQSRFVPLREGDPLDLAADLAGIALGAWAARRWRGRP